MKSGHLLDILFEGYKGTVDLGTQPPSVAAMADANSNFGFEIEFVVEAPAYMKKTPTNEKRWRRSCLGDAYQWASVHLGDVKWHASYSANKTNKKSWHVEPDGSVGSHTHLSAGVELSSPVFGSVSEGLANLKKALGIVKGLEGKGLKAYTNGTCGLHLSLGLNKKPEQINILKMLVLYGEKYVARMFGREGCSYAQSVLQGFVERMKTNSRPSTWMKQTPVPTTLDGIEQAFEHYRSSVGHSSAVNLDHYSLDKRKGYFEFRVTGGEGYEKDFGRIESVVRRYTQALAAACSPGTLRKEYLQKLSQLAGQAAPGPQPNKLQTALELGHQYASADLASLDKKGLLTKAEGLNKVLDHWMNVLQANTEGGWKGRFNTWKQMKEWTESNHTREVVFALRYYFGKQKMNPAPLARIRRKLDQIKKRSDKEDAVAARQNAAEARKSALQNKNDSRKNDLLNRLYAEAAKGAGADRQKMERWVTQLERLGMSVSATSRQSWGLPVPAATSS